VSADLHLHTTASDGRFTPAEVVARAKKMGFSAVAITDHDTVAGLPAALAEGEKQELEVIPGIELSTLTGDREIHILGFYVDFMNSFLAGELARFIEARQERAVKMVEKLNAFGVKISLTRVKEIAGTEFIGRPHIAGALLEQGYINDIKEAFSEHYIGRGGAAYVERFKLSPAEGIALLKKAGAIAVLAHPGYLSAGPPLLAEEITPLVEAGLQGLEAIYSRHTEAQVEYYKKLAESNNLLITGGSDCHGDTNETNPARLGKVWLPYKYVKGLKTEKQKESLKH